MIRPVVNDEPRQQVIKTWTVSRWSERWQHWKQRFWHVGYAQLMHQLPVSRDAAVRILEVGCGRGDNLLRFAGHFANAQLVGLESVRSVANQAEEQIQRYQNRIDLYCSSYGQVGFPLISSFDVLLLPYQLSQTTTWQTQLDQAYRDLKPGGIIAVLDFYKDPIGLVQRRFLRQHGLPSALLPLLKERFVPLSVDVHRVYAGLWQYFSFVGIKPYI